jgi:hypothetical protein
VIFDLKPLHKKYQTSSLSENIPVTESSCVPSRSESELSDICVGCDLLHDTIRSLVARITRASLSVHSLHLLSKTTMGSSVSRLPENLTEQECKKLAGIRWDAGLSAVFAAAPKNEDGTISKTLYLEHFQVDPFQVISSLSDLTHAAHTTLGSHHGCSFGPKSISQR